MQLEGVILKQVLIAGANRGVLAIPTHDAIAAEFDHQYWAKDKMENAWKTVMSEFHKTATPQVTINFGS